MDFQCIALDLDRTTLNAQSRLSAGNRAALEHAASRGVHIVIASGRPLTSLPEDVLSVSGVEYAITSNGAAVYHLPSQTRIAHHTLPPDTVDTVLDFIAHTPCALETFVDGQAYAGADFLRDPVSFGAPPSSVGYFQRTRTPVEDLPAFLRVNAHRLDSLDLILPAGAVYGDLLCRLQPQLPDCYITSSVPHLLELAHKNAGKHTGVQAVARALGISLEQIIAFGDGDNDADMLRCVGCGVAVANASPACLAAADRTTGHHDADGVAGAIYQLIP